MALTPVRVTGKYLSTDGRSAVDPTKLVALPPVKLPGEQAVYPVAAKLRGDGEFLLPLFADSAAPLTYALTETLGGSTRTVGVTVPAGASGELKLANLAGYSQPPGAVLDGAGELSLATLRAAFEALGAAGSVITRDPAVSAALMVVAAGTTSDRRLVRPYELRPRRFRAHNIGTGDAVFSYNGSHDFWNFNPDGWQETTVTPGQELLANYTLDPLWVYSPTGTTLVLETTIGADL